MKGRVIPVFCHSKGLNKAKNTHDSGSSGRNQAETKQKNEEVQDGNNPCFL